MFLSHPSGLPFSRSATLPVHHSFLHFVGIDTRFAFQYMVAAAEDELWEVAVVDLISAEMSVDRGNDLASEVVVVRDTFEE